MADRISGLSIGLDLDSMGLERSLGEIKRSFKSLGSSIKVDMNNLKYGEKNVASYRRTIEKLDDSLKKQRKNLTDLKAKHEEAVRVQGANSSAAQKLADEYNKQANNLNYLERQMEQANNELRELQEQQRISQSSWGKMADSFESIGDRLTSVGDKMKDIGKSMSMYVTAPLVGFGTLAAKTGIDFDDSMAKVQAISGATGDDLQALRDKAKEMGATTKFSASDSAEALNYMAMAGWKTNDMLDGLEGIMSLAAASGEDLGTVSDIVTDALTAFGLKAEDSGKFADILASASANANTNVGMLGKSFEYVAPVAGALGYSVEDTSVALGLMANSGIKADKAGTALRTMLTNLAKPTKQMKKTMDDLDISLTNQDGSMKTLDEIMQDLRKSFGGLTKEQQASSAAAIFGKEAMSGALAVINSSEEDYNKLSEAINNSSGSAKKMSDIMEGTLGGKIREIKSGLEGFAISIYEAMLPALSKGAEAIKGMVGWLNNLSPSAKLAAVVFGAIAAAIGPLLVVFGILLSSLGSIAKAFGPVARSIARAGGLIKWLRLGLTALTGPVGLTIAAITLLTTGFILLYKKSDTFRGIVGNLIEKLKELGGQILEKLKSAVSAVADFFRSQMKVLQDFWNQNSETIMQALKNIGKVVSVIFNGILKVIQFVMPFVLSIIKSIWGNIKGVIQGALKVIMGLIQFFSGLLTGDFSKMWTGIKNIFSGALQFIWNYVQLMLWGKMLKGILSLGKLLVNAFKSMWSGIRNIFSTVIRAIVDFVKNRFTIMKNGITSIFTGIRNFASSIWTTIRNNIQNPIRSAVDFARSKFSGFKDKTVEIFNGIKNKVTGYVSDMVSAVKNMPGKMKDGLVRMSGKISEGVKTIANKMASGLGKGVNGVIGGVNWVTDKLGIKSKISKWDVPQYAHGTGGHKGGLAIVGDGKGSNAGPELIQTPDGKTMLSPAKDTLVNLPKGSQVLSALETKSLLGNVPKYAKGIGGMIQTGIKKAKDFALNIWDYATNPGKLLDLALSKLGIARPDNADLVGKLARGGFDLVKGKAVDYIKSAFSKAESEGGNVQAPNFGGRFRRTSGFGQRWGRLHGGVDYAAPIGTPIPSQSSGVVSFASNGWNGGFGNLVKVKQGIYEHFYAHMSRIMTSVGKRVSKGSILGLVGSTGNSTGPHVHYELRKNGMRLNPGNVGFATGGLINSPGMYNIAEGGYPEWIIPTDPKRRTDAMKLLALAGKDIQGNKRPNQLSNPAATTNNDSLLNAVMEQNKILMALLQSSRNIEKKPVISEGDIGRAKDRYDATETIKRNIFNGGGVMA